jgi:GH15 family glucan-1,4-alpha-glucosidase
MEVTPLNRLASSPRHFFFVGRKQPEKRFSMGGNAFPSIDDYGYIADCHSAALVSGNGSIDWCCMPRIDSESCFARILDGEKGGYCQIVPSAPFQSSRRYLPHTLVLETTFQTEGGKARLLDCLTMREGGEHEPHQQILRVIEGISGQVEFSFFIVPRFDYGAIKPWIRRRDDHFIALGGRHGLLFSGDCPMEMKGRHRIGGSCSVEGKKRARLSILYRKPEDLDEGLVAPPSAAELDRRLEDTIDWWNSWTARGTFPGPYADLARCSAIVLKGLSNAPTGAIAAAATTSLPEAPGGSRNWDYRFSWVRDSAFTVRSLAALGFKGEADGFRRFIERSAAGSAEELQILFGLGGERRLQEYEISWLQGYRGAKPVRVGNAAANQIQLDIYGELVDLAWRWYGRGHRPDDDYGEFLVELVNSAAQFWAHPDQGIWEMRGKPRHFVHSKAMCWGALDRGIKMAEVLGQDVPAGRWRKAREEIRQALEEKGYDTRRGVFIQAFGERQMDAALLLLPITGFVEYTDERMVRTTNAVWQDLQEDGLLRRYAADQDGLEGREGVFLACSFWLVECLARQGRLAEAHKVFQRAVAAGNDLGLFAEEYDPQAGEMLGNFPQGLTHLSLIAAVVALAEIEGQTK